MTAVMIVEDDEVLSEEMGQALIALGYDLAGSPGTAAECIALASERRPDLVLMDIGLEGGMDGIEAARILRSSFDIPVVFATAHEDDETLVRARESEPNGYILKPFRISELRIAIEMAVFKHRLESQLRERERWFSTTLGAIGDAVITIDSEERVTFVNRTGEILTRQTKEDLLGRRLQDVLPLIDERTGAPVAIPTRAVMFEHKTTRLPPGTALANSDGDLPIEDSLAPIVGENGKLWGAVMVFRDVSERRKLEKQLALADRLTSLGTLASGVAHEINNPLTYVLGNVSVAQREIQNLRADSRSDHAQATRSWASETALRNVEEALGEIYQGAENIRRIVADLQVIARPDVPEPGGSLKDSLEWALRVAGSLVRGRARLESHFEPVPRVRGGTAKLGQVFLNLLINAAHAIPEGHPESNTIRVTSGIDQLGRAFITVQDTGVGMSAEVLKQIFDPFFTTKRVGAGTGLGLSICHSIVESLGGEISVESTLGRGSKFRVSLPIMETLAPLGFESVAPVSTHHGRILVVDDDVLVARSIERILSREHAVVTVLNAEQAFEKLNTDQAFDAVLCDIMMPGMTGIELFERIKTQWPGLAPQVIFLTGAISTTVREFLASVPNARLTKPFVPSQLTALMQSLLRDGGVRASA
jgi:PAS domain S-box-containing protein